MHQRRAGGQSKFCVMQDLRLASGRFDKLIGWARTIPAPLDVDTLAARAAMRPRRFARVLRAGTTGLPLQAIAAQTG